MKTLKSYSEGDIIPDNSIYLGTSSKPIYVDGTSAVVGYKTMYDFLVPTQEEDIRKLSKLVYDTIHSKGIYGDTIQDNEIKEVGDIVATQFLK